MCGIGPIGGGLRQHLFVVIIDDVPWLVGDLHERNIMRDVNGAPAIIDALVGEVTLAARRELGWLRDACEEARKFRETGLRPARWDEVVEDGEL